MAHKFTQHVFHPTNGSFLHTSCENCGAVVGQSDQPCPHPAPPVVQLGNYLHPVNFIEPFPSHILISVFYFAFDEFHLMR
jgi:hypothetical protein